MMENDNIMDLIQTEYVGVDSVKVAQCRIMLQTLVNAVYKMRKFSWSVDFF
jgi:hypothetical protein